MGNFAPWMQDPTQMDPATSLGLQLLANSNTPGGFGSIFGKSALQAGQSAQANQLTQQQIQQNQLALQSAQQNQAFMNQLTAAAQQGGQLSPQMQALMGGEPQSQQPGVLKTADADQATAASPGGMPPPWMSGVSPMSAPGAPGAPGAAAGPAPAQQRASSGALPSYLTPLTPQDISSVPVGGLPGPMATVAAMRLQKKDAATAQKETLQQQYEAVQRAVTPKLQTVDWILKNGSPSAAMKADPQLVAAWPQLAQQAGIDPTQYTDDNVRSALGLARNKMATSIGLPETAIPKQLLTRGNQQIDPVTLKVEHEEGLEDVDLGNGKHALVPQSQAIGKPKYNASAATAGSITDQAKELAYQRFKATGDMPASGKGGAASQTAYANYFAKRAAEDGDDGAALAARSQQYKASQGVVKDFTSGTTSKTLNGLNTAIGHMDIMDQAATALQNGNVQALNKVSNFFGTQFGGTSTNNFNIVKNFAAGEVAKAVLPGGGGEHEREEIADAIKSSNSPAQLHQAIALWKDLLSSKTDSLRNQWEVGTNGKQGEFDKFLLPATKKALGVGSTTTAGAHPPDIQDLLSKYGH